MSRRQPPARYRDLDYETTDAPSARVALRLRWNSYANRQDLRQGLTLAKDDLAYLLARNRQLAAQVHLLLRAHELGDGDDPAGDGTLPNPGLTPG